MTPPDLLARIRVVLCRPSHPGNIGAAARAMKTMGLHRLVLVSPKRFPDEEADTRATGAIDVLQNALVVACLPEALAGTVLSLGLSARARELGPAPRGPREAVDALLAAAREGDVALVFGNETVGLTNDELQHCSAQVTIPTNPAFSSLNLGAAVQVLCYECRMAAMAGENPLQPARERASDLQLASHDEIEGLHAHLETVMTASGFFNPRQPGRLLPKLRRLFGKAQLEKDEINILRGILAATQQNTGHGKR